MRLFQYMPEIHKQRGRASCSRGWVEEKVWWCACLEQEDEQHVVKMGRQVIG